VSRVSLLVSVVVATSLHGEQVMLQGVERVMARQKTLDSCWAAAIETVARSQRVNLTQEQVARDAQGRVSLGRASYQEITDYLKSGWHGAPGTPGAWTTDTLAFKGGSIPDQMLLGYFRVGRPVIMAYTKGSGSDHALVAVGGDFDGNLGTGAGFRMRTVILFDPIDGKQDEQDWAMFKPTLIGAWLPTIVLRDGCNVFGPNGIPAGCEPPVKGPTPGTQPSGGGAGCRSFAGAWRTAQNEFTPMNISQTGCSLSGSFQTKGQPVYSHALSGTANSGGANFTIELTAPTCRGQLFGNFMYMPDGNLLYSINGSTGNCMPANFREQRIWVRQ
jgi:hypothetical protein